MIDASVSPKMEQRLYAMEQQLAAMERRYTSDMELLQERYDSQIADLQKTIMLQDSIIRRSLQRLEEAQTRRDSAKDPPGKPPRRLPVHADTVTATPPARGGDHSLDSARAARPASRARSLNSTIATTPRRQADTAGPPAALPASIQAALAKHQPRLNAIYDYYTHSSGGDVIFHPTMGLSPFTRLVRDCRLTTTTRPGATAELLWMAVVRALRARYPTPTPAAADAALTHSRDEDRQRVATPHRVRSSTRMARARTDTTGDARDRFEYLRLEKIPRPLFGEALVVLWRVWAGDANGAAEDAAGLDAFLARRVLPRTAAAMERRRRHDTALRASAYASLQDSRMTGSGRSSGVGEGPEGDGYTPRAPTGWGGDGGYAAGVSGLGAASLFGGDALRDYGAVVESYSGSTAVKAAVKEFAGDVKRSYHAALLGVGTAGMGVDEFFAVVRRYRLLPLITKLELKEIFRQCATPPPTPPSPPGEHPLSAYTLTLGNYLDALYCLAESIYSVPAVAQQYPTPDARLHKLFAKMFVLEGE